jgi:hypothetical protein
MERDGGGLRTSWDKVFDAVEHAVTFGLEHRVLEAKSMRSASMGSNMPKATST